MELTTLDRLLLLGILPAEGDVTTLRIVRDLQRDLSFSEQEYADLQLVQADGQVTWDRSHDQPKDVSVGLKATNLIVGVLQRLSDDKKLTSQHLALWDKFVGEGG